jgi:hypothetical protein
MFKVYVLADGEMHTIRYMEHLPRVGDRIRFSFLDYGNVDYITWTIDEDNDDGEPVYLYVKMTTGEMSAPMSMPVLK